MARNRRRGIDRRRLLGGTSAMALGLAATAVTRGFAAAQEANKIQGVELPPDIGQTDLHVYVPATGHSVRGSMLDYWRANGAAAVYGNPISEPFASDDGYYSQAFERGIFQYRPEFLYTEDPIMRLMAIGPIALTGDLDRFRADGRRGTGGGDRRAGAWRALNPNGKTAQTAVGNGELFDADSGHTVTGDFLDWYNRHEGGFYLGKPLSQRLDQDGALLQFFEGGVLAQVEDGACVPAPVPIELAPLLGFDPEPVNQGDLPLYDEELFDTGYMPNPLGDPTTPGRRWIEVSLPQQQLWAYQGETAVMTSLVSTGLAPNLTSPGLFHIRLKYPTQTMTGFTNSSGEVVGFGTDAPADAAAAYDVPDIPNVMYFSLSAEALHGCYWHNNFGNPMSHGCVNLPLDVAAWMYGWAPLGTMVWVHE